MREDQQVRQQEETIERKKSVRGIKIRTMNYAMIFVSFILYIFLIFVTVYSSQKYDAMIKATYAYINYQEYASYVEEGSDYLTEQVRLYTVEMDPVYVEEYFNEVYVTRSRETALEELQKYDIRESAYGYLRSALDNSNRLMEREIYAMKLIAAAEGQDMSAFPDVENIKLKSSDLLLSPEMMIAEAREMVFGQAYQDTKKLIENNISYFLNSVKEDTKADQQKSVEELEKIMLQQQILISILFVETILTFILILCLIVKPLHIYVNNIKEEKRLDIVGAYEFKYLALTYNDIYELNAANELMLRNQAENLRHQAEHDPLTGIYNRGAFDEWKALLKAKSSPMALLIIDVDKFKHVNDGYGHEMGDRVLKKVASLLVEAFRETDIPARIGGDEFAVIVANVTKEMKNVIYDKIKNINNMLMNPVGDLPQVSLSVGGAFSESGFADDLYRKADAALYEVKENGRCGCRFYEDIEQTQKMD